MSEIYLFRRDINKKRRDGNNTNITNVTNVSSVGGAVVPNYSINATDSGVGAFLNLNRGNEVGSKVEFRSGDDITIVQNGGAANEIRISHIDQSALVDWTWHGDSNVIISNLKFNKSGHVVDYRTLQPLRINQQIINVTGAVTDLNLYAYDNFYLTLTVDTQLNMINTSSNMGRSGNIIIKQDSVGGHSFTLGSNMMIPLNASAIDKITAANSLSIIAYHVASANEVLLSYIGEYVYP